MVYCRKCGQEILQDAKYCPKCGKKTDGGIQDEWETAFENAGKQFQKAFEQASDAIKKAFSSKDKVTREEYEVSGTDLVDKVKELVHEGNVRRVIIKDQEERTLLEFPLTVGVIGAVLAPILAAIGAIATLAMKYKIIIEKKQE
jgi:hypothetical protein